MSYGRPQLPRVTNEHVRVLRILNETGYDTREIRRMVLACLRFLSLKPRGAVRVVYSSQPGGHHGVAAIGRGGRTGSGLNMALSLPRDPTDLDGGRFAWLIHHEALHWRGVRHEDMTEEQRYWRWWVPSWYQPSPAQYFRAIAHVEPKRETAEERRLKKLAHAQKMLARAERRARLAATVVKRWRLRVGAAERAISKGTAHALDVAADRGAR